MSCSLVAFRICACKPKARRVLNVLHLKLKARIARIEQRGHRYSRRYQLMQEPQTLRLHGLQKDVYSGRVAARPVEAGDHAELDRIIAAQKDDWDCRCGHLRGEG